MQNSPSESVFDALKDYQDVAMEFTSVREFLLSKAHRIDEIDFTDLDIMERCKLIAEIQDCLYDLQLIEWAERSSFIAFITSIFLLSKSRCTKRKELEKSDPSLVQNDDETTNNEQHQHDIDVENLSMDNKRKRVSRSDYAMESYFQEQEGLLIINHGPDSSNPNNDSEIDSLKAEVNTERKRCRYKRSDNASFRDSPFSVVSPECVENSGREADDCESDDCEPHSQKHDNHENDADNEDNVDDKKIVDETDDSQSQLANKPLLSSRKRPVTSTLSDNSYSRPGGSPRKKTNSSSRIEESLEEPDPNSDEPTYCLCKQVSYGDMVCCDNPACSVEWFHFECVNVKTKPKGRWLCPDCKPSTQQNRKQ